MRDAPQNDGRCWLKGWSQFSKDSLQNREILDGHRWKWMEIDGKQMERSNNPMKKVRKWDALGIQWDPLKSNQLLDSGAWEDLKEYGAIVFRGFEISKDKGTFGQVRKFQAEVPSGICDVKG